MGLVRRVFFLNAELSTEERGGVICRCGAIDVVRSTTRSRA